MPLDALPVEILWRILLFSRSSALPIVSHKLWRIYAQTPRHIQSEFLLCCWLDSYALRFTNGRRADSSIPAFASTFIPTQTSPGGSSIPQRRAATADILSFVARFGICTPYVFRFTERTVLRTPLYGNITQRHGLFPMDNPGLYPKHLACHTVPERVFQRLEPQNYAEQIATEHPALHNAMYIMVDHFLAMSHHAEHAPLPPLDHLELILRMILVHCASANSSKGYPLAMAAHKKSIPLISFLLAAGADPEMNGRIALQLAAKKKWLFGLQLLLERDEKQEQHWRFHLRAIKEALYTLDANRGKQATIDALQKRQRPQPVTANNATKRLKLQDRCMVDTSLLKTAVRSKAWDVVAYMMERKGVIPDVETIKLMEAHQKP